MIELTLPIRTLSHGTKVYMKLGYQIYNEYQYYEQCPHIVGTKSEDPKLGAHSVPKALVIETASEAHGPLVVCLECLRDACANAGRPL